MRSIGFFIVLFLLFSPRLKENTEDNYNLSGQPATIFRFKQPAAKDPAVLLGNKDQTVIDTNQLKQSNWYAEATRNISESEYEIKPAGTDRAFGSPNREQNLRAFYTADHFTLQSRTGGNWKLELTLKGVYSGKKKIYPAQQDANPVTAKNTIRFTHNDDFTVEYINSKQGVRQNFIIEKEPAERPEQLTVKLQANNNWLINLPNPKEIHFAKTKGGQVDKKITYNSLKAWDANNKELDAFFSVYKNEISVNVITENAVYPVTIDPLSTGINGTADWIGDDANQPSSFFGYTVSSAGDVNGDGYSDVIMGAYGYDEPFTINEGQAFVYHGSSTGLSSTPNSQLDDGNQNSALFGRSVACAGDMNGDGYSDVIVGADMHNDMPFNREGRAYIYYGSATGLGFTYGTTLKDADQADANFGWSVAGIGDVNGDGFSDVAVGAYNYDDGFVNEGKVFVYYGISGNPATITAAVTLADADQVDAQFGVCVAGAGDVNGDGYSDIIVGSHLYNDGANTDEGRAFVYYGSGAGLSTSPLILSDADQISAQFGFSVACGGDLNGDGYSDVIVSANLYDDDFANEGVVFIYYGSSSGLSATHNAIADDANQANANFGGKIACAGDVNGDGYSDVIIGAYTYDDNLIDEGVAFIYYGSNTGLSASPVCMLDDANGPGASFGYSVASAGDVNGDGYSDVIIGAYTFNYMGNIDYGLTYVYNGSPSGIISSSTAATTLESNQGGAYTGAFISSAGDVNADGYSDVIIGAPFYDHGQLNEGVAFVYHGSVNGLSAAYNALLEVDQASTFFGFGTAPAGDVNGDGYGDIIIGCKYYNNGQVNEGAAFVYHGSASGIITTPATLLEKNQAAAQFGYFVGAGGDMNGDGYSDVIVGAPNYSDGLSLQGAAFVFYGSSSGINPATATLLKSNQAFAQFGISAACAGDINGDGFSDVIVGSNVYDNGQTDEGVVYVYHGSETGVNTVAATTIESNKTSAQFGIIVASAGDVNADGYCDVIVGAYQYANSLSGVGSAFIYHGSASGLITTPATVLETNQSSGFGVCAASAGDVNGDGYGDVIVGAWQYSNGESGEGAAYIYNGSITGINTIPSAILESNQGNAIMGLCVASAGDINGDGYSDVLSAAPNYDNGESDEGVVFLYIGNNSSGLHNNLRLYNSDLITPIQQSNMSDPNLFGIGLFAKSPLGRQKGKMVWETVRNGNPFSGIPVTNSTAFTIQQVSLTDLGLTGVEIKNQVAKMIPTKATYVRARVKYDLTTAITGQVYGP
ncbi:MAG TPA: integrin alpha, partial [Chitinophagaceae bacterium]|nr:integrin alpha [Chitinophagaceae bacterium]